MAVRERQPEGMQAIPKRKKVWVTKMGHITEIQVMDNENRVASILKLDKDTYLHIRSGEVREFVHNARRLDDVTSLRRSMKQVRYLINANFKGGSNELWLVLTYAENMLDEKRLYSDIKKVVAKLRRKYGYFDYLMVPEPQGRGCWHANLLLKFAESVQAYIPHQELTEIWGYGFVWVRRLKDIDNLGAYLSCYLADLPVEDAKKAFGEDVYSIKHEGVKEVAGKKYLKGARLHFYPAGMRFYRKSKGIKHPERVRMSYGDARNEIGAGVAPVFKKTYRVEREGFSTNIHFEEYNVKRSGECVRENTDFE